MLKKNRLSIKQFNSNSKILVGANKVEEETFYSQHLCSLRFTAFLLALAFL